MKTWKTIIKELKQMYQLHDNWDGENTPAPKPNLIQAAISLAQSLQKQQKPPPHRTIVSTNGTIYLEWCLPNQYQEIEITSPNTAQYRPTTNLNPIFPNPNTTISIPPTKNKKTPKLTSSEKRKLKKRKNLDSYIKKKT